MCSLQFLLVSILVIQTPLSIVSQECVYYNRKTIISEWGFFEIRNSNTLLFLTKLSADVRVSSFLSDSLSKAKVFQSISAGNKFYLFHRFWYVKFSDKFHLFILITLYLLEKSHILYTSIVGSLINAATFSPPPPPPLIFSKKLSNTPVLIRTPA